MAMRLLVLHVRNMDTCIIDRHRHEIENDEVVLRFAIALCTSRTYVRSRTSTGTRSYQRTNHRIRYQYRTIIDH